VVGRPVLQLSGVTRIYGQRVQTHALRGVDLTVETGEQVAIIGPSGSGKTTLLNIMGLLDRASGGRLEVNGQDVSDLDDEQLTRLRGRSIGFVYQFHHLLPAFTAAENVALPLAAHRGRSTAGQLRRARDLLERVGLRDRADHLADALSGGQQQRVAVARALAAEPDLLLADEPTGNLDSEATEQVFTLLEQLNRELDLTLVLVTHDRTLAARCPRVVEVVDGRVHRDGPPPETPTPSSAAWRSRGP
jgi:lipoprotein-releasing system ATP-binding protein